MWKKLITNLLQNRFVKKIVRMAESESALKRPSSEAVDSVVPSKVNKKGKKKNKQHVASLGQSEGFKRKIALLVSYNGSGYYGVQVNGDYPTIEKDLFAALVSTGAIPQEHSDTPSKMWFQRGSRTDKGVSAVGQVFSLKAVLLPDFVDKVNAALPDKIRIMGYIRTTNGFDSKNFCCGRTYTYMMPTFGFAPIEKFITDEFRVNPSVIERVRSVLKNFIGTHKFHNFTSGVKPEQACAARYITGFECSDPYVRDGIEFVTITVKGQSFMLHQIRKMIGITIAVVRGYCGETVIDKCWGPDKVDIPKAPGLGLVLEELHFDGYNKKFGQDGIHDKLDWGPFKEEMAKFKEQYIISDIVAQEKADRVMFNWMRTLQYHNFAEPRPDGEERPWNNALKTTLAKNSSPVTPKNNQSQEPPDPDAPQSEPVSAIETDEAASQVVRPGQNQVSESPEQGLSSSEPVQAQSSATSESNVPRNGSENGSLQSSSAEDAPALTLNNNAESLSTQNEIDPSVISSSNCIKSDAL